jgi:hypothetical protein
MTNANMAIKIFHKLFQQTLKWQIVSVNTETIFKSDASIQTQTA